jgi:hypothetical protein
MTWSPTFGRGANDPNRVGFLKEVARQLKPGDQSVAETRATYQGKSAAIKQQEQLVAQIEPFEKMTEANVAQFEREFKTLKDYGSPIINETMRTLNRAMFGSPELKAMEAARSLAMKEVERITASANLLGPLHVTAMEDMKHLISGDMTLSEMLNLLRVFRADVRRRAQYLREGLKELRGSFRRPEGGGGEMPNAPAGVTHYINEQGQLVPVNPGG